MQLNSKKRPGSGIHARFSKKSKGKSLGNTQRDQKQGLEFSYSDYQEIDKYCKSKNIEWFASAWDINSQLFLRKFNCKYNKVASAMIVYLPLRKIAEEGNTLLFLQVCQLTKI